jgi:dolichol-phosphate mannosyltransferase
MSFDIHLAARSELTVVVPTLNDRDNIGPLIDLLDAALESVSWEAIFIDDDAPDGTPERIREISRRERRVRCVRRLVRCRVATPPRAP